MGQAIVERARQGLVRPGRRQRGAVADRGLVSGGDPAATALDRLAAPRWDVVRDMPMRCPVLGGHSHVAIGPTGVFLVATTPVKVATVVRGEVLAHFAGRGRTAAATLAEHLDRVVAALPRLDPEQLVPVVCCPGDDDVVEQLGTVRVCTGASLLRVLETRRPLVDADEVTARARALREAFGISVPGQRSC